VLSRIEVRNYQSLRRADIPLGQFTVVTGRTGSGKSALFRALELLALNARGTSYVSHGQKSCSVTAGDGRLAVRLTRSVPRSGGKNEYQVARLVPTPKPGGEGWSACKYTKLGGQVPPQVRELLGLTELNFAGQHDPPYLLSLPGTEIARRLGDLTNVSLVLGAAAEAGRIRKQHQRDLDAARAQRAALLAEAQEFAGLRERRAAVTAAGQALARAQATAASAGRLRALAARLEAAERAAAAARAEAARQAPPSLERLEALAARAARLRGLAGALEAAERDIARFAGQAERARADEHAAEQALHDALAAAGRCPVCGSTVT
jgi:DNA repair ATPase RecN